MCSSSLVAATIGTRDVIGPLCPCQTAQVSDEDVRTAAAFCVSFGKIPVVTPSSSFSSLGVSGFVSVYHWALATRLVATHNLSPAWLDKCLVKAGFTKGPFAVMEEVSALCLNYIICSSFVLVISNLCSHLAMTSDVSIMYTMS